MFVPTMMNRLYSMILSFFLIWGLSLVLHEEQANFRQRTGSPTEIPINTQSAYSFSASATNCALPSTHQRSLSNDEKNNNWISDVLFVNHTYTQNHAPTKLFKLKKNFTGQTTIQHSFSTHLAEQSNSLSFTPNAIRYLQGFYIYTLGHILI